MDDKEIITITKQLDSKVGGVASALVATDYKDPQIVLYSTESSTPSSQCQRKVRFSDYNDKVGALVASDSKGIKNEYVEQGKVIVGWIDE